MPRHDAVRKKNISVVQELGRAEEVPSYRTIPSKFPVSGCTLLFVYNTLRDISPDATHIFSTYASSTIFFNATR